MGDRLADKVVLITGAGSGIGRATALAAAHEGGRLVLADIDPVGGAETVRLVQGVGGEALFCQCDVAQAASVKTLIQSVVDGYGRLDAAVNNAGIDGVRQPLHLYPEEIFDRVIQINLKGVWLCMREEISVMLSQGGGAIVNTASVAGLIGAPLLGAYDASKHGVVGLTRTAAIEYAPYQVRVNAVCPSYIRTPMVDRFLADAPDWERRLNRAAPMGRMGLPEEVAQAIVWLCSDAASFVTGHTLTVDGGLTAL